MSQISPDRLFNLLPAVHRLRDAAQGKPLQALLSLLEDEYELLEADLDQLYDDAFIETCAEWVVPYIGDLLGVRGLLPPPRGVFSQRARVANTIAYRRAKGTAAVLEQLARDSTGWAARVVEYFERLAATQYLNHTRLHCTAFASIKDANSLELLNGPFESATHTGDVRHIDNNRGRYNIPNIGLNLWRLERYALTRTQARPVPAAVPAEQGRFTFSPVGLAAQLFNTPRTETELSALAGELNVPGPLRRRALHAEVESLRQALADNRTLRPAYFAPPPVLSVFVNDAPQAIPPEAIVVCDLSDPENPIPEGWRRPPTQKPYTPSGGGAPVNLPVRVSIDPQLGRIAFPSGVVPSRVDVTWSYGFSGDLGGGPYDRQETVAVALTRPVVWQKGVTRLAPPAHPDLFATLREAVDAWNQQPAGTVGVIAMMDSSSYEESLTGANTVQIPERSLLVIAAADWPDQDPPTGVGPKIRVPGVLTPVDLRPHIRGDISVRGTAPAGNLEAGALVVNGLLIEGNVTVLIGNLGSLEFTHSTLAPPGRVTVNTSVQAGRRNEHLTVTLCRTITGPVDIASTVRSLRIKECIVDAGGAQAVSAPAAVVEASTILGLTRVRSLEASNSIFTGRVNAERRQLGCVRFSYLPIDSLAPRRFRCQPASALDADRISPQFTSTTYQHPGYMQLGLACPCEISTGADDEDQMGAFHFLGQAHRIKNLRAALDEYLRFGLETGIYFAT